MTLIVFSDFFDSTSDAFGFTSEVFMRFSSAVADGTPLALPITFGGRLPLAVADRSVVRSFAVAERNGLSSSDLLAFLRHACLHGWFDVVAIRHCGGKLDFSLRSEVVRHPICLTPRRA